MPLTPASALRKDVTSGKCRREHRHFATVAAILRTPPMRPYEHVDAIVQHFADELADTNPNFDRARFVAACMQGRD